jgi:hypothetical protein
MLTETEIKKVQLALCQNAIPFKFNNERLITIPAVLSILNMVTKSNITYKTDENGIPIIPLTIEKS